MHQWTKRVCCTLHLHIHHTASARVARRYFSLLFSFIVYLFTRLTKYNSDMRPNQLDQASVSENAAFERPRGAHAAKQLGLSQLRPTNL